MNTDVLKVFHELMKKGWIGRSEHPSVWALAREEEVLNGLEEMGRELDFEIVPAGDRLYMVPTIDNDLFLKNNADYRTDIGTYEARRNDLFLMNYLAVFILFSFFRGEGADAQVLNFALKENLISDFSDHCRTIAAEGVEGEELAEGYSDNMKALANDWLGKREGAPDSRKLEDRYGILNRLLGKFRSDDLFEEENGQIRPTKKLKDLMPYVLRKQRVAEINSWLGEGEKNAADN